MIPELVVSLLLSPPLAGATPLSPSPSPVKAFRIDSFRWQRELAQLGGRLSRIEVVNPYGDIRAGYGGPSHVEVLAAIQRLGAGPDAGVTLERRGEVLLVVASLPAGLDRSAEAAPAQDAFDRVDLTVMVPLAVTLHARSSRGQVVVRQLESDVEAATVDGNISIATNGAVQVSTRSGHVGLELGQRSTGSRPCLVESLSGPIEVVVPPEAELGVVLDSGGELGSDWALEPLPSRDPGRRRLAGVIGRRVQELLVRSETGSISLRKKVLVPVSRPAAAPAPAPSPTP